MSGWIIRDHRCNDCGKVSEHMHQRNDDPVEMPCPCGGQAQRAISAVCGRVKLGEVSRGKNGDPPPNALDTRPLADGMPMSEWKARNRKRRQDEIHRMAKDL